MEAGRIRNLDTKMKGTINQESKLTDIYLPRKCDYTDKIITSKDHSSIQISIADVPPSLLRSMMMEPSTSARTPSLLSQDSWDRLEKVMLPCTKSSRRRSLSDRTGIFNLISVPINLKHHQLRRPQPSPSSLVERTSKGLDFPIFLFSLKNVFFRGWLCERYKRLRWILAVLV